MRYYLIAGEASGDLHGSNLIRALKHQDSSAEIRCWGGDKMKAAGAQLMKHYRELAFMGFVEVLSHLSEIAGNFKKAKADILSFHPDVLVLIDYPGFNLRMAKWAKKNGIKVCYYISPQVWAWKESRVKTIKTSVDKMLVILPFEKDFYKKHGMEVTYTGHPLTEIIGQEKQKQTITLSEKPIIALLPGSRKQEILQQLPPMLQMVKYFPNYQFIVAKAPSTENEFYQSILSSYPDVKIVEGQTYNLLNQANAALVTSGTATLETALFDVPEIVCYKGNRLSYLLAKKLIKVKYISLVNLILDKPAIKELIQHDFNEVNLKKELNEILNNPQCIDQLKQDYTRLWKLLKEKNSSQKAAQEVFELAKTKQ